MASIITPSKTTLTMGNNDLKMYLLLKDLKKVRFSSSPCYFSEVSCIFTWVFCRWEVVAAASTVGAVAFIGLLAA